MATLKEAAATSLYVVQVFLLGLWEALEEAFLYLVGRITGQRAY